MKRKCGKWGEWIRKAGFRCTLAREVILETLEATADHLSPEDIYNKIKREHQSIGLTTVYRTLETFVQLGLIEKFDFGDGRSRYELAENISGKNHHHHLVCRSCGKIMDYSDFMAEEIKFISQIEKNLEKKYEFKIENHNIKFSGLCKTCMK
jgi:Fur family transcriptional regulator, ferric uptake regulator